MLMFQTDTCCTGHLKTNLIIDQHIRHCVKQAFAEGNEDEKVREIIELIDKYAK